MQFLKHKKHEAVEVFRFGYSPFGKPYMTVYCYYLDGLLIDTAQRNCEKLVLETFQNKPIEQIALTHWHEDHTGNLSTLATAHHAKVLAHPITQEKLRKGFKIHPYEKFLFGKIKPFHGQLLDNQAFIETNSYKLVPIFTPGHSEDHTVFLEKNNGWLFAGDLWVGVKIRVFRKDEKFWQQVESFKKVLEYDFDVLFCGHNPRLKNGKELLEQKLQYFEDFGGKVLVFHQKGLTNKEIIKALERKESLLIKALFSFDVSLEHMIEAAKG
jgi:glyoxylase-like metal-dependent hydrolase (beta-lactamase superfamily II)